MSKEHVLVTGGAGLIGSHLCDRLIAEGHSVTCIDNFITGRKNNLKQLLNHPNFTLIEADVSDPKTYTSSSLSLRAEGLTPNPYTLIYHLASPASPIGYLKNPVSTYQVNAFGTHYLLEFAKKTGARILYTSTSESYGDPLEHPQKETYWGNVNPVGIRACYDESKRFGEMACMTFYREYQLDVRVVRIFNTYGPRNDPQDGRVVPSFIMSALKNEPIIIYGDGTQTRSFCYVSDLVDGLIKAMLAENQAGLLVNLGNPDEFTMVELAQKVKQLTGSTSEFEFKPLVGNRDDDPQRRKPDISKAKSILNWEPTIKLEEGLKPTIEYFRSLI